MHTFIPLPLLYKDLLILIKNILILIKIFWWI